MMIVMIFTATMTVVQIHTHIQQWFLTWQISSYPYRASVVRTNHLYPVPFTVGVAVGVTVVVEAAGDVVPDETAPATFLGIRSVSGMP